MTLSSIEWMCTNCNNFNYRCQPLLEQAHLLVVSSKDKHLLRDGMEIKNEESDALVKLVERTRGVTSNREELLSKAKVIVATFEPTSPGDYIYVVGRDDLRSRGCPDYARC